MNSFHQIIHDAFAATWDTDDEPPLPARRSGRTLPAEGATTGIGSRPDAQLPAGDAAPVAFPAGTPTLQLAGSR